jgi:hypothetical protein
MDGGLFGFDLSTAIFVLWEGKNAFCHVDFVEG